MLNFRQKIFVAYLILFILFLLAMSPIASLLVHHVVEQAMQNRTHELIAKIETAPSDETIVRRLKELKPLIFFRISVINDKRKIIYDSHTRRLLGARINQEEEENQSEVLEAFRNGTGYSESYSDILAQKFAYTAVAFDFHGKNLCDAHCLSLSLSQGIYQRF